MDTQTVIHTQHTTHNTHQKDPHTRAVLVFLVKALTCSAASKFPFPTTDTQTHTNRSDRYSHMRDRIYRSLPSLCAKIALVLTLQTHHEHMQRMHTTHTASRTRPETLRKWSVVFWCDFLRHQSPVSSVVSVLLFSGVSVRLSRAMCVRVAQRLWAIGFCVEYHRNTHISSKDSHTSLPPAIEWPQPSPLNEYETCSFRVMNNKQPSHASVECRPQRHTNQKICTDVRRLCA